MDEGTKKQLLLSVIDKILFGVIILIISVVLNFFVEKKINEIELREQDRYKEGERLKQILESVSKVNSDLVVEQRKGLTKWMGSFFMEVSSCAPIGQITQEDLEKLNEITENIKISIYQIEGLSPNFSEQQNVKLFLDTLLGCNIYLGTEKKLKKHQILNKLDEVRNAYSDLLEEIRKVSIELARIDYKSVKQ